MKFKEKSSSRKSSSVVSQIFFILFGIAMIFVAYLLFYELKDFEENGGSISLPIIFMWIYKLLGKYAITGIIGLSGIFIIIAATEPFFHKKQP
jgi:uncharacterized membrane protein YuzA (DUF378 family)